MPNANPDDPILREMEVLAVERSFPIVGPQVGQLLHMLARAISARRVIELGSGFGYSAYWFARAVGPLGVEHPADAGQHSGGEGGEGLPLAHQVEVLDVLLGNPRDGRE